MAEAVSAVHIDISAQTAKLEEGVKKAQDKLRQLGKSAERDGQLVGAAIGRMVATAGGLAAAFIGVGNALDAFQRHIDNTTALDSLSQATGISVQRLHELQSVAKIAGLEVSSLTQAASVFGARMTEAVANPLGRTSLALSALGINIREADGSIKSFETVLLQAAERFPRYADGANKAAIAAAIFGEEAGPRLVALLNRGRGGIEELQNKVRSAYRAEDVEAVRRYRQATVELQESIDKNLLPALTATVNALTAIIGISRAAASGIASLFPPSNTVQERERAIAVLEKQLEGYREQLDRGAISAARFEFYHRQITAQINALRTSLSEAKKEIGEWQTTTTPELPKAPTIDPRAIQAIRGELALYMAQLNNLQGLQEIQTQAFIGAWERQRAALVANHATAAEIEAARIGMMQQEFSVRNQLLADSMGIEEQYRQRETQLREAAKQGIISEIELRKALQQQNLAQAESAVSAIGQGLSALRSAWPKVKAFAIAETIANGLAGAIRAYKDLPTWLAIPVSGMILAATAKNVANIASTNPGSGSGSISAPSVSAGAGGIGSSNPAQAAPSQSLTISLPAGRYTHDEVMAIIEGINDRVKNGATLISTKVAA
jgi:hypothetical protein